MFRTIWSKTLRDYRIAILSWGLGLALLTLIEYAVVGSQSTASAADTYVQLGQSFRFLADPVAIATADGYTTWRALSYLIPLVLSIWTLLAGARMVRGEEERRSIELLLSTPNSRIRLITEKFIGQIIAVLLVGLLIGLGALAGQANAKVPVDAGRALLAGLNVSLITLFFGTVALFLSQFFTNRSTAAGLTGGLLTLFFLIDGTGRTIENGVWLQRFSPFYYYNLNKPLISTYTSNIGAALLLLGGSLLLFAASAFLFARRDIDGVAFSVRSAARVRPDIGSKALEQANHSIFGRAISLRTLYAQAPAAFWWIISICIYTFWMTLLTPSMLEPLRKIVAGNPSIARLFTGHNIVTNAGFLGYAVFAILPVLVVSFALMLALKWVGDLDSGRMELILSMPKSRTRILLEHFAPIAAILLLTPLLVWLTLLITAQGIDLSVNAANVAAATLSLIPLELLIVAFVYSLAERVRGNIILSIVSTYLLLAYVIELIRSLLNLPEWVMSLSIFHAYGSPLLDGWRWGPFLGMLALAILLLIGAIFQFRLSDIDRGA